MFFSLNQFEGCNWGPQKQRLFTFVRPGVYNAPQKMYLPYSICIRNAYVLNEFLTADRSCKTKYF